MAHYYEGVLSLVASVMYFLSWGCFKNWGILLLHITIYNDCEEGLEAVVFIGGIGIDQPLSSISPLYGPCYCNRVRVRYFSSGTQVSLSLKICLVVALLPSIDRGWFVFQRCMATYAHQDYVNKMVTVNKHEWK
ncbi:ADM_collapsed_G0004130.mRNA.1.CDS.1 [Saccharomyces cerevisiae]|nr:ADM_collapsed_G0004130.mRNA.1.CDS.1 [Saccharomyces cerevisiae]